MDETEREARRKADRELRHKTLVVMGTIGAVVVVVFIVVVVVRGHPAANAASAAPSSVLATQSVNPDETQCNLLGSSPDLRPSADMLAQPLPGENSQLAALLTKWSNAVAPLGSDWQMNAKTTRDQNAADAAGRAVASWCTANGYPATYTP